MRAYTQRYGEIFDGREYWTIDPVARLRRYGSERHIVDHLQNLGTHVPPGYFDLVVCNGVLGWGLNAPEDANTALAACHTHLRARRRSATGVERHRAAQQGIARGHSGVAAIRCGAPRFWQVARWAIDGANRHVFDFYRKPLK